jgi:hypothetical protein
MLFNVSGYHTSYSLPLQGNSYQFRDIGTNTTQPLTLHCPHTNHEILNRNGDATS